MSWLYLFVPLGREFLAFDCSPWENLIQSWWQWMLQKECVFKVTGGAPSLLRWLSYLLIRGPSPLREDSPQRRHILRRCLPSLCNNYMKSMSIGRKSVGRGGTADKDRPSTDSTIWAPDLKGCYCCRAALLMQSKSSFPRHNFRGPYSFSIGQSIPIVHTNKPGFQSQQTPII